MCEISMARYLVSATL